MNDFRRRVLIGAGIGGGGGALLGAANALKDHGLDTTTEDVLEQMWNKGSVGALGGAGVGALGHLIYEAKRKVKPPIAENLDLNKINFKKNESALNKLEQGIADEKQQAHNHVDALLNTPPVPINKMVNAYKQEHITHPLITKYKDAANFEGLGMKDKDALMSIINSLPEEIQNKITPHELNKLFIGVSRGAITPSTQESLYKNTAAPFLSKDTYNKLVGDYQSYYDSLSNLKPDIERLTGKKLPDIAEDVLNKTDWTF